MASDADRHLLFGLLALQTGLIQQAQLVAAFHAWTCDKSRSLADHLISLGHLTAAQRPVVEALAALHVEAHGGDVEKSLAAVPAGRSTQEDLAGLKDPDIEASLGHVASGHGSTEDGDTDRTSSYTIGTATSEGQRFRVLRPHARGGLGAVFVALDTELKREVALKQILDRHADDANSRARFLLEAEITGRLEHPGVVPVYGMGSDAQGRPFYAMRFVKGQSLKEAIDGFHEAEKRDGGDPRQWNLALRQLLNRFVAVCNVMAYAHSRGVIHRDLKPANILLGPYGETLVVDWGLAKVVGRGEAASKDGAAEATLQPGSGSGSSETMPGTALGTPAYMSPEQAEGRLDQVGPLSDVYSLGATLYYLLTGKPPLGEIDVGEALRRVQRGEFPPPRAVRPSIPQGLEAICLKAMALKPEARYPSAPALADEIEHWLADEPVSVYREPISVRLTRWGRRHRTLATSIGVLLITTVVGLAIATALIRGEQLRTKGESLRAEISLVEANRQRTIAEDKTREADLRAENLRRQDYVSRINIAHREVQDENIPLAEELLQGCPRDLRGWEWHYVNRLAHLERLTFRGHQRYLATAREGQSIQSLAFSPDGTWIASGAGHAFDHSKATDMSEIRLWDSATGRERRTLGSMPGTVQSLAISPDGTRLAAGGGYYEPKVEGWLKVWEVATGRLLGTHPVSAATVMSVAFSPDGKSLAVGYGLYSDLNHAGYVKLHRVTDGTPIGDGFGKLVGGVNSVSFHRDGQRIALAGFGQVEIWDIATRTVSAHLLGHTKWVYCTAFSPDGTRLATGGFDQTVRLWDTSTGAQVRILYGHKSFVRGVAFSPDGKLLASVSEGNDVRLWEVATSRELATFHGHPYFVLAVAFQPDGRRIASGGVDGTVKIWDLLSSRPVVFRGHTGWVTRVAFRRDGRRIASQAGPYQTGNETFRVWDPATGEEDPTPAGGVTADPSSDFGPGGRMVGTRSSTVTSRDRRRIAESERTVVHVKDAITGQVLTTLKGHTGWIFSLDFSPDGRRIATASGDNTIKIWDAEDGREVLTLRGHTHTVGCVAFSPDPDGHLLASGSVDTTVRVWDATPFPPEVLREQEARRLVPIANRDVLFQSREELIERLRMDSTLSQPVFAAALGIIEVLADDPESLSDVSWEVIQAPDRSQDDYLRALRRADSAMRLAPENGTYLKTLGVALYRVGRNQEAIDTLNRASALDNAKASGSAPTVLAFLAMAHHRLGHPAEARAGLDVLRALMKDPEATKEPVSQAFLREAEMLIDPKPVGSATEPQPPPR